MSPPLHLLRFQRPRSATLLHEHKSTELLRTFLPFSIPSDMLTGRWIPETQAYLERLIEEHARQDRLVIFDFDNTIICRDVGDTTFAYLAAHDVLDPAVMAPLSPAFRLRDMQVTLNDGALAYYEALQQATAHQRGEQTAPASGYVWAVQVMAGLALDVVLRATSQGLRDAEQETAPYPAPFVYPEMVDLIGVLLLHGFRVHIVSATNVWSVRWMVRHVLNPALLARYGTEAVLQPHQVTGMGVLLRERTTGCLYRDALLVRQDAAYAELQPDAISQYELTSHLDHPLPTFGGKVGVRCHLEGDDRPLLVAGDSLNDLALLKEASQRLWMARLERPDLQRDISAVAADLAPETWAVQPVLTDTAACFVRDHCQLSSLSAAGAAKSSLRPWLRQGWLCGF